MKSTNRTLASSFLRRGVAIATAVFCASCSGGGGGGTELDPKSTPANEAPTAFNMQMQAVPTSDVIIRVLDSSVDPDGDKLTILYTTQPEHGVVSIEDNGTPANPYDDFLRFVCNEPFVGLVSFQYTISDGSNGRATGTVQIQVGTGSNNAPGAVADSASAPADTAVAIDVLANDFDPDGDSISISSFSVPMAGAVVHDDNGTVDPLDDRLVYTPIIGFVGQDSFTYTISDGDLAATAVVNVNIGAAPSTEQVCGVAMKGALEGALVQLFVIDDNGVAVSTTPVAQAITDVTGNWCANVPESRGPLLVRASGGQFIDETDTSGAGADRRTIVLDSTAYLETVLPADESFVAINVYTNAILEKSRRTAAGGSFEAVFRVDRDLYRQAFGWPQEPLTLAPQNPAAVDPGAPESELVYAMALGGIANVINDVAVRFAESEMTANMIRAVVVDLADCLLDGYTLVGDTRTRVSFDLNGTPQLLPDDLRLNTAILRFRNNNLADFGSTALAQIDGGVCLGADDGDDLVAPTFVPDPLSARSFDRTGPLTDLLAVTSVPLVTDNIDPRPDVVAVSITASDGSSIDVNSPDVAPGDYDILWRATDDAGNTTARVQRITINDSFTGVLSLTPDPVTVGNVLTVHLDDADLNLDPVAIDSFSLDVTNLTTGEAETLLLTETSADSGQFSATVNTSFGTVAGPLGDNILELQSGDVVQASYNDEFDADGNPQSVDGSSTVVGGDTATLSQSPTGFLPGDAITITLSDADLDVDPGVPDSYVITVVNPSTTESENVLLNETGASTGVFQGVLTTQFGISGSADDGIFEVQAGEQAQSEYFDALTGPGDNANLVSVSNAGGGNTATLIASPPAINPGDTFSLELDDPDLDTDPAMAETFSITVSNTTTLDTETVVLTETGISSGVFRNNAVPTQAGPAGISGDGLLDVQNGETLRATYSDALTDSGSSQVLNADVVVGGGADGTVSSNDPVQISDTLDITVTDADENGDPLNPDTLSVTVDAPNGDSETVTLTETGPDTDTFTGSINVVYGVAPSATPGNVEAVGGDTLTITYVDVLTLVGDTQNRTITPGVIGGSDGTVASNDPVQVAATLDLTVTDADENGDPLTADTVDVTVNATNGDSETVTLTETGPDTDTFTGSINVVYGTAPSGTPGNVEAVDGDSLTVTYVDVLSAAGDTQNRTTVAAVESGVDGTVASNDPVQITDTLDITVTDADENGDPLNPDTISVTVDAPNGDSETVTLTETGADTNTFTGSINVVYGVAPSGTPGNVEAVGGDTLTVTYVDAWTAAGDTQNRTTTPGVIGGDDAVLTLGAIGVGSPFPIEVSDADMDTSPGDDAVLVNVRNTRTNEIENNVVLAETGSSTGVFQVNLPTQDGGASVDNDGVLTVIGGDLVEVTYQDDLTSAGDSATRIATMTATLAFADLRIEMSFDTGSNDTVWNAGGSETFSVTLYNDGTTAVTGAVVKISAPNGARIVSSFGDCCFSIDAADDGLWTVNVASGASVNTLVEVQVDGNGDLYYPVLAEVFTSPLFDPDSTPGNQDVTEDDAENQTLMLRSEAPFVWTGGDETSNWNTASNWRFGAVPGEGDEILIPRNSDNAYPRLPGASGNYTLAKVVIAEGAQLRLGSKNLVMTGDLIAMGPVTGGNYVEMQGTGGQIQGTVPHLDIYNNTTIIDALTINGPLHMFSGRLYTNGQFVTANDVLEVSGTARLNMTGGGDMSVALDVTFNGGDHGNELTAGVLRVNKDFLAEIGSNKFQAGPGHTTVFNGTFPVELKNPGDSGSTGSYFGSVVVETGRPDFKQETTFTGQFEALPGTDLGFSGGNTINFESALPVIANGVDIDALRTVRLIDNVTMDRDIDLPAKVDLLVDDDLVIGSHSLTVNRSGSAGGDLTISSGGELLMNDPAGSVFVDEDFRTSSTLNHNGQITAGILMVGDDFIQDGGAQGFVATGSHITRIGSGGGTRTIQMQGGGSEFNDLEIIDNPTLRLNGDLTVTGTLTWASSGVRVHDNGAAYTVTATNVDLNGVEFDGVPVILGDAAYTQFDNIAFTNMDPADDQLTVEKASGSALFSNIDFQTWPDAGGFFVVGDGGGTLTIDNYSSTARPLHGEPWSDTRAGFTLNWGVATDDSDGDGLNDGAEATAGANPLVSDTDGDGLSDPLEVSFNSSAFTADTDGDLVGDYQEYVANSDPNSADDVIFVDPAATGLPADGTSWNQAYRDLATADLSSPGSFKFVLMAAVSTATGAEWQVALDGNGPNCDNLVFMGSLGDGIWVPEQSGGYPTTHLALAGAATGSVFDFEKCTDVQLHDLYITDGDATAGGAVHLGGSSAILRGLVLENNTALQRGGALAVMETANGSSTVDLDDIRISGNSVSAAPIPYSGGGGIFVDANSTVIGSNLRVSDNLVVATVPDATVGGAGIYLNGAMVSIDSASISNNVTNSRGGGVFVADQGGASGALRDSVISGNNAAGLGGGAYFEQTKASFEFMNNIVSGNAADNGGGVALSDSDGGGVYNNTLVYNQSTGGAASGGAVYALDTGPAFAGPALQDNILRGNIDGAGAAADIEAVFIQSEYNITDVTTPGGTDAIADPVFTDGYYLSQATSPAVDFDTSRDATVRMLETYTTDPSAAVLDNNANLDAGYHYASAAAAAVAAIGIVEPVVSLTAGAANQDVIIEPQDGSGNPLGSGLEVIIASTSPVVTLQPVTTAEPLGAGNGNVAIDLGDGRYLIRVDASTATATDVFTADIVVNRAAPQPIAIPID